MARRTRTYAVIGAFVVVAVVVVGAIVLSSRSAGDGDRETVTWWVPNWDRQVAGELVEQFEEENPDLVVELVETTADTLANRVSVALESGDTPDVITELASRTRTYIGNDQLADLTGLYDGEMPTDDFIPGALDAVSTDDGIFGVTYRWDAVALLYNEDLFAEADVEAPTTWDEFEEVARQITEETGVYGAGWPMNGNPHDLVLRFMGFALSGGTEVVDGEPQLTPESTERALEIVGQSVADGWASPSSLEVDNTGVRELFINGQVGMYIGGVFDVNEIQDAGVNVRTAVTPGAEGPGTQLADGWTYIVPQDAPNMDGAERLVQFLGSPSSMESLTLTYPARDSAAENPRFHDEYREPHYLQVSEYSVPPANDPGWVSMVPYVYSEIQAVALGDSSAADAAADIVAESDRVLGSND